MSKDYSVPQDIYGPGAGEVIADYRALAAHFENLFGQAPRAFYRAPGRVELGGNHTDHQGGVTLSASVDLDMMAAVAPREDERIVLDSAGYGRLEIELWDTARRPSEQGSTAALLRGMLAAFQSGGFAMEQGLDIALTSRVPAGSGLSSSAAFEILLGSVFNDVYGAGALSPLELACMAQHTENEYFGKPCGLLDQLSCAQGGVISVDFSREEPRIRPLSFRMEETDYQLFMVLCGAGHADLTGEYAAIPAECHGVAACFGKDRLCQVAEGDFWGAVPLLRKELGDRPVLRAIHVYEENRRARAQALCLENGDFEGFLKLVRESGRSSAMYLQNAVPAGEILHQELLLTLALCEHVLEGRGAVRLHGGGFGGTACAFVPREMARAFTEKVEGVLGSGAVLPLSLSPLGGCRVVLP